MGDKEMKKINILVGQSGGPTAAINATLAGVIERAMQSESIGTVYGARNGIKGILRDDLVNLSEIFADSSKLDLLKQTPSAYLGSCRYRVEGDDEIAKIIGVFKEYDIGCFFYIGGNDSMDTVLKLSAVAKENGIAVMGIPKTIDNDLSVTDHCPGYGSSAKYIATVMSEVTRDTLCYDIESVTIVEIMGRNAGWLTAAAALARVNGGAAPHLIYLPEVAFDTEKFVADVRKMIDTYKNVVVAVSEGIKDKDGKYISSTDILHKEDLFGHSQLGGVGKSLEMLIKDRLKVKVRSIELNTPQRCAAHIASLTDIEESAMIGGAGVDAALSGHSGEMMIYRRRGGDIYSVETDTTDIAAAANEEKKVPAEFISAEGNDVTAEFIEYALPLIQGECDVKYKNGIPQNLIL